MLKALARWILRNEPKERIQWEAKYYRCAPFRSGQYKEPEYVMGAVSEKPIAVGSLVAIYRAEKPEEYSITQTP